MVLASTFFAGGTATARKLPFLFWEQATSRRLDLRYPTFQGGLNAQGGVVGRNFTIGAINPLLKSPKANIWSSAVERRLGRNICSNGRLRRIALVQHRRQRQFDRECFLWSGHQCFAGRSDRSQQHGADPASIPASAAITYADNDRYGNYQAHLFRRQRTLLARIHRCFLHSFPFQRRRDSGIRRRSIQDSITGRRSSMCRIGSPSVLTIRSKGLNDGKGAVGRHTGGWGISGTSVFQSGYPLTAANFNGYNPVCGTRRPAAPPARPLRTQRWVSARKWRLQRRWKQSRLSGCRELPSGNLAQRFSDRDIFTRAIQCSKHLRFKRK